MTNMLSDPGEEAFGLAQHQRRASHTLNLVATKDAEDSAPWWGNVGKKQSSEKSPYKVQPQCSS